MSSDVATTIPSAIHKDLFTLMTIVDKRRVRHGNFTQRDERRFWFKSVVCRGDLRQLQQKHQLSNDNLKRFFVLVMIEYEKTRKWWSELKKNIVLNAQVIQI